MGKRGTGNVHGMNWIRKEKRLAIYLRDGLACLWCDRDVEHVVLTLDHIVPRSRKGSNDASNLITSCRSCNSRRQDKPLRGERLAQATAAGAKPLDVATARGLIAMRGWRGAMEARAAA